MFRSKSDEGMNAHTRGQSIRLGAIIGVAVALLTIMIFVGVHIIVASNQARTNRDESFVRNVTCQVINAETEANAETLSLLLNRTPQEKRVIHRAYELRVTRNIERNLHLKRGVLVNRDGSVNCATYVRLGNQPTLSHIASTKTTSTGTSTH